MGWCSSEAKASTGADDNLPGMRFSLILTLLLAVAASAQDARVDRILRDVPLIDADTLREIDLTY